MPTNNILKLSKPVKVYFIGEHVFLPEELQKQIESNWESVIAQKPSMHNGEVFTVVCQRETSLAHEFDIAETDYAHFVFSRKSGGLGKYSVRNIHPAVAVIIEGKIVLGKMADHTSLAGTIQMPGGGIDRRVVGDSGEVDIYSTMATELSEELGLDTEDEKVGPAEPMFLWSENKTTGKFVVGYVLKAALLLDEFKSRYEKFILSLVANNEKPEFDEIITINNDCESVEKFIHINQSRLNPYIPDFLRAIAGLK